MISDPVTSQGWAFSHYLGKLRTTSNDINWFTIFLQLNRTDYMIVLKLVN